MTAEAEADLVDEFGTQIRLHGGSGPVVDGVTTTLVIETRSQPGGTRTPLLTAKLASTLAEMVRFGVEVFRGEGPSPKADDAGSVGPRGDRGLSTFGSVSIFRPKGGALRVNESSVVGAPRCWLHTSHDWETPVALTLPAALALADALERFVAHAQSPDNWRNTAEYRELWGPAAPPEEEA